MQTVKSLILCLAFAILGCSGSNEGESGETTFIDKLDQSYEIEVPKRTTKYVKPPKGYQSEKSVSEDEISFGISSLRLENSKFLIKLKDDSVLDFAINKSTDKVISADRKFQLQYKCQNQSCYLAWLALTKLATNETLEIQFESSIKYFTRESAAKLHLSDEEEDLVLEAAKWTYPVQHDQSEIKNGPTINTLTVRRPKTYEQEESTQPVVPNETVLTQIRRKQDVTKKTETSTTVVQPPSEEPAKPVETPNPVQSDPTQSVPGTNSDQTQRPDKENTEIVNPTPSVSQTPVSKTTQPLQMTSNLAEAYGFIMPEKLVKNKSPLGSPLDILPTFQITPISQQDVFEPAWRIAEIAQAFIDQKIPIKANACNIYVRSVMIIAGYRINEEYLAREFHKHFESPVDHLNQWEKDKFEFSKKSKSIDDTVLKAKSGHAMVMQIHRPNDKYDHVALLVPQNGKVTKYEASIYKDPPHVENNIQADLLLSNSNRQITLFSLPGLIDR